MSSRTGEARSSTHTYMYTLTHTRACIVCTQTCKSSLAGTYVQTPTHKHVRTCLHACTNTYSKTHMLTTHMCTQVSVGLIFQLS